MYISQHQQNGSAIYTLHGRLDDEGAQSLRAEMPQIEDQNMVLDMRGVDYINSNGLRFLAGLLYRNQDVQLVEVNPNIERALRLVGLDGCFQSNTAAICS
jgi:anti-anti-sigma factor